MYRNNSVYHSQEGSSDLVCYCEYLFTGPIPEKRTKLKYDNEILIIFHSTKRLFKFIYFSWRFLLSVHGQVGETESNVSGHVGV